MPRAHRYVMALPIRYRPVGDEPWVNGMTVNISSSGVLFEGERRVDPEVRVEMDLVLPREVGGSARVIARGTVVRAIAPATGEARPRLAATIVDYDFVRNELHG